MPGVSIKTICPAERPFCAFMLTMPWMRLRVVWGLGVTMAIFSPTSTLSSVLLPAFGRPMMETNPERNPMSGRHFFRLGLRFGAADPHFVDPAVGGFEHLKAQAAIFNHFTGFWNTSCQSTHQFANSGRIVWLKAHIEQYLQMIDTTDAFH